MYGNILSNELKITNATYKRLNINLDNHKLKYNWFFEQFDFE